MIRQLRAFPNQLTLLRLIFIPFIVMTVMDRNYVWAFGLFIAAGISDALDGILARLLKQKTTLGQFLDPVADKLLLSTCFLMLSFEHLIPWRITSLVFSRDVLVLVVCAVVWATTSMHDFRPSWLGKANTVAEVLCIPFVLLYQFEPELWVKYGRRITLEATFVLTILSGVHYLWVIGQRLHTQHSGKSAAA
jgi:cardiolipin synthase (CMP-forming)